MKLKEDEPEERKVEKEITNEKPKKLILDITVADEEVKAKLRGAIKFFAGDRNNVAIKVQNGEQILPCGGSIITIMVVQSSAYSIESNRDGCQCQ